MLSIDLPHIITLLPFVILALIYLLVLHTPHKEKIFSAPGTLKPGTRVVTKSGIIGCIAKTNKTTFILETYDGTLIEMDLASITEKAS